MQGKRKSQAGFSLVELMVVVTIIGILAAIAVPRFQSFRARAQQTEAKSGLGGLFLAMESYRSGSGDFPLLTTLTPDATLAGFGFNTTGGTSRYLYKVQTGAANQWAATANSKAVLANSKFDVWRINANKDLGATYDAVNDTSTATTYPATVTHTTTVTDGVGIVTAITFRTTGDLDTVR